MFKFMFSKKAHVNEKEALDRRRADRSNQIFIAELNHKGKRFTSTVYNVSQSGFGIFLNKNLKRHADLDITINNEYINGAYSQRKLNRTFPVKMSWIKKVPDNAVVEKLNINKKNLMAGVYFRNIEHNTVLQADSLWDKNLSDNAKGL